MTEELPPNVYRVPQRVFDAIPGAPWVYWVSEIVRSLFETCPPFRDLALPTGGMTTGDNARFLRYWWEVGLTCIGFGQEGRMQACTSGKRWFPYMKGGVYRKWYGNQDFTVNWQGDGQEIRNFDREDGRAASYPRSMDCYFREGVTWSDVSSGGFAARVSPGGFVFDASGPSAFPLQTDELDRIGLMLGYLNSRIAEHMLGILNPTIHFQVGDVARLPVPQAGSTQLLGLVRTAILQERYASSSEETTYDFIGPSCWDSGLDNLAAAHVNLAALEAQIDDEVYRLYGISVEDRALIEAELAGGSAAEEDDEGEEAAPAEDEAAEPAAPMTREELAVRWISYAVGVVLGRFTIGDPSVDDGRLAIGGGGADVSGIVNRPSAIGNAVFRRDDFAVGSLPEPDEAEFDALVGPPRRFAYVDGDGGRHVFSAEVEAALRVLALPDGIAVLDEGHPRDLPTRVEQALALMLGDAASRDVIAEGARGDLRGFLERDFFTRWHLRWYRKRPVYWPLQSARRGYGFVVFHERIERATLYVLQRDYLDHKLNGLRLEIGDLRAQLEALSGAARKRAERQIDRITQLTDEVSDFAQTMERIVRAGYEPEPNWIDDGVILRMAPLWELIPIWKSEPRKHWERLQRGDFDWSHIAMRYWPERVRDACNRNKSFAIAHGRDTSQAVHDEQ